MARRRRARRTSSSTSSAAATSKSAQRSRRRSTSVTKPTGRAYVTDSMVDAIVEAIMDRYGLRDLGVKPDELRELLRPVIDEIADTYSSRPSKDQILARMLRNEEKLLELIASYLAETREEFDEQLLEFIVYNLGASGARLIPKLYREAKRAGREDLIDILRGKWLESGLATPYQCPRCGFYALTPNLTCVVCGAEIDEEEFKDSIDFEALLEEFAETATREEILEVISEKRVAYDGVRLKPPSQRTVNDIELHLSRDEVEKLRAKLR